MQTRDGIRYLAGIGIGWGFAMVGTFLLLLSAKNFRWHADAQFIGAWFDRKCEIASAIQSPKILFAGGSNVQYGIQAELFEAGLGKPAVNFGLHGALPLDYLIKRTKEVANPHDIIVFAPEYEYFFRDPSEFNLTTMRYLAADDQDFLLSKNPFDLLLTIPADVLWARFFHNPILINAQNHQKLKDHLTTFNTNGDRQWTSRERRTDREFQRLHRAKPTELATSVQTEKASHFPAQEILDFHEWCLSHNIQFIACYPNTMRFPEYSAPESQEFLAELSKFYRDHHIPNPDLPDDAFLETDDFFDSVYHPHQEAAHTRTQKLFHTLKPILQP